MIDDDTWRKSPGKKDTKRWCKGKVGREHVTAVERPNHGLFGECDWRPFWRHPLGTHPMCDYRWSCHHAIICQVCRKVLRWTLEMDCPDLTPKPEPRLHPRVERSVH